MVITYEPLYNVSSTTIAIGFRPGIAVMLLQKRLDVCITKRDTDFTPLLFSPVGQKFRLSHMIFTVDLAFR